MVSPETANEKFETVPTLEFRQQAHSSAPSRRRLPMISQDFLEDWRNSSPASHCNQIEWYRVRYENRVRD